MAPLFLKKKVRYPAYSLEERTQEGGGANKSLLGDEALNLPRRLDGILREVLVGSVATDGWPVRYPLHQDGVVAPAICH